MKKIIQFVTQKEAGGAQIIMARIDEGFRAKGMFSRIFAFYSKRETSLEISEILNNKINISNIPSLLKLIRKEIEKHNYDAVISHTHYSNLIVQIIAFSLKTKNRIAVHHNSPKTYAGIVAFIDKIYGTLGIYTKVVLVADHLLNDFSDYPMAYRKKILVIKNGIEKSQKQWKPLYNDGRINLVCIGRLSEQKNHIFILRIVAKNPTLYLTIIGDGEMRSELEKYVVDHKIEERVQFAGQIDNSVAKDALLLHDIFVFPSVFEAMPIALMEAMNIGIPIIASNIPSNIETLKGGGIAVDLIEEEWIKAIEFLKYNSNIAETISIAEINRSGDFELNKMVDEYERIL